MYKHIVKRFIGLFASVCGLVVCCIPMLIIAICIKCDSKGPVLFKQVRLGKGMKSFTIYKFRTMCEHAYEMGGIATSSNDARITKVGAFLRRTSLDELPQMFNILNGTMAIIGPRPVLDWEFEPYKKNAEFCKRYSILPGFFCTIDLINRKADRETQFAEDARYAENLSFGLDFKTFFGVIAPVIQGKNVYNEEENEKYK